MVTVAKRSTAAAPSVENPWLSGELVIEFPEVVRLTDDLLCELASLNELLRLERDEAGRLVISMGPDFDSNSAGGEIMFQIAAWDSERLGLILTPTSTLHLPDASLHMPDAGWLSPETTARARSGERPYPHVTPDFVVEVRSSADSLSDQQRRMEMWMRNGVQLGWLVDPQTRTVWVYRPNQDVVEHQNPSELSAEPPCSGLAIGFASVW